MNQLNKFELKKIKPEHLIAVFCGLILFVVISLLLVNSFQQNQTANDSTEISQDKEYLDFEDNARVRTSEYTIELPQGWVVKSNFKSLNTETLECVGLNLTDCIVYEISNDSEAFFVSLDYPYIETKAFGFNESSEKIQFAGKEVELFKYESDIVKRTDNSEGATVELQSEKYIRQAYLCIQDSFCISTGILPLEAGENTQSYDQFKSFLNGLSVKAN